MQGELTFLVRMKLVPIASELEIARASPMYLSSTISQMSRQKVGTDRYRYRAGRTVERPEGVRPRIF